MDKPSRERGLYRSPHNPFLLPILLGIGFVLGLLIGRWWALIAPAALATYVGVALGEVEVPPWVLASLYGLVSAAGVALGVVVRRRFAKRT